MCTYGPTGGTPSQFAHDLVGIADGFRDPQSNVVGADLILAGGKRLEDATRHHTFQLNRLAFPVDAQLAWRSGNHLGAAEESGASDREIEHAHRQIAQAGCNRMLEMDALELTRDFGELTAAGH